MPVVFAVHSALVERLAEVAEVGLGGRLRRAGGGSRRRQAALHMAQTEEKRRAEAEAEVRRRAVRSAAAVRRPAGAGRAREADCGHDRDARVVRRVAVGGDAAEAHGLAAQVAEGRGDRGLVEEAERLRRHPRLPPVRHEGGRDGADVAADGHGHGEGLLQRRGPLPRGYGRGGRCCCCAAQQQCDTERPRHLYNVERYSAVPAGWLSRGRYRQSLGSRYIAAGPQN